MKCNYAITFEDLSATAVSVEKPHGCPPNSISAYIEVLYMVDKTFTKKITEISVLDFEEWVSRDEIVEKYKQGAVPPDSRYSDLLGG